MTRSHLFIGLIIGGLILFAGVKSIMPETEQQTVPRIVNTVVIDAGHGGKDPGTIGTIGTKEKDINLSIALKLKDLLEQEYDDMKIILTRSDDRFIELRERGRIANSNGANLFISIHANAKKSGELEKKGFELYILNVEKVKDAALITDKENVYYNGAALTDSARPILSSIVQSGYFKYSEKAARIIQAEMVKGTKLNNRGVHQEPFIVLYGSSMPSILVECGYLSDKDDESYLRSESGQSEVANSIYKSVRFFKFDYDFENQLMVNNE